MNNNNDATSSSLIISGVEQEEAMDELALSFGLWSWNSELENREESQLEYFSALEVNTNICDNVEDEDKYSDDESYVDDYFRMMEIGW